MHTNCARDRQLGISLVELLIALAVLAVVTTVTVARLKVRAEVNQAGCAHGLKETGLAFRQFANDNADRFPAQVAAVFGGAREAADGGRVDRIFQVLADYQAKPDHVICPADSRLVAPAVNALEPQNLSYFVNLDAAGTGPGEMLLGDRDLKPVGTVRGEASWIKGTHRLEADQSPLEWSGVLHRNGGNLALTDGSVKPINSDALVEALRSPSGGSSRVLFPQ